MNYKHEKKIIVISTQSNKLKNFYDFPQKNQLIIFHEATPRKFLINVLQTYF